MPILTDRKIFTDPPLIAEPLPHDMVMYHTGKATLDQLPLIPPEQLTFATFRKITEVVTTVTVDCVDITGLDINTHVFYLLLAHIKNPIAGEVHYFLYVNNDFTATNYYTQFFNIAGTAAGGGRINESRIVEIHDNQTASCIIYIMRNPDGYSRFICLSSFDKASNVSNGFYTVYKTTVDANITSLRISANYASAIGANSRFILFGLSR